MINGKIKKCISYFIIVHLLYYIIMSANLQQIYKPNQDIDLLCQAIDSYNALHLREDNFKLDLDTCEGQQAFREYAEKIEKLMQMTNAKTESRQFRDNYTRAYRILYSQHQLGYIPQVFDSAQEAFPCIWVNGDRFDFTQSTIQKGEQLVDAYFRLIQLVRFVYLHSQNKFAQIPMAYKMQLRQRLEEFDSFWIEYERIYISELIVIEEKSKQIIIETVNLNEELTNYENQQKIKGKIFMIGEKYHSLRRELCEKISKINSVANINGKGRDDLSYDILQAAEGLLTTITDSQSKSVRQVAEKIRETFGQLREVFYLFSENIQVIDPQLKNNPELVNVLQDYESFWEKGKRYFIDMKKSNQILAFSTILEAAKQKYDSFRDLLEFSDPNVFWIMPCLVVLSSLEGEDEGLARSFLGNNLQNCQKLQKQYIELQQIYKNWKQKHSNIKPRQLYNELEHKLIDTSDDAKNNEDIITKIKQFGVSLERVSPTDWNDMLSVLLIDDS